MCRCLEPMASEEENMEYTKQLILSCLLNICQKLSSGGSKIPAGKNCQTCFSELLQYSIKTMASNVFLLWVYAVLLRWNRLLYRVYKFAFLIIFCIPLGIVCKEKLALECSVFILTSLAIKMLLSEYFLLADIIDKEKFNVELIVQCIRISKMPQTHHHALLLLGAVAVMFPVSSTWHLCLGSFLQTPNTGKSEEHTELFYGEKLSERHKTKLTASLLF